MASRSTSKSKKRASKHAPPTKKRSLSAGVQWALIFGVGALIIGAIVFAGIRDAVDDGGEGVVTATAFDLPALGDDDNPDNRVRLADFRGTPTVVNFFASWCVECDRELPAFRDTAESLAGQVDFIFVNTNETGNWESMVERNGIGDFTLAKDIQGTRRNGLYRSLRGTGGMPMTAFYDADGNLLDVALAVFDEGSLRTRMSALGMI